jgi:hypothetical protein
MITWTRQWIGRYTDLLGTLDVLRQDLRDGYITGFLISPSYFHDGYDAYTSNTEGKAVRHFLIRAPSGLIYCKRCRVVFVAGDPWIDRPCPQSDGEVDG